MDYEKKYKEAVCEIQKLFTKGEKEGEVICAYKADFESIFPELKESEGEKVRKGLIAIITDFDSLYLQENYSLSREEAIAWLEKHGEQKPAEWSEEDLKILKSSITLLEHPAIIEINGQLREEIINWLESLKDRVKPQPKQEWSEEDKRIKNNLLSELTNLSVRNLIEKETEKKYASWLKSIKDRVLPQNRWKPSATDIQVLEDVIDRGRSPINYHATLHGILEHLKKLREE